MNLNNYVCPTCKDWKRGEFYRNPDGTIVVYCRACEEGVVPALLVPPPEPSLKSTHETVDGAAITPFNMSDTLAAELVQELDLGDWELDPRSAEFIESNLSRTEFSVKQKQWIYNLARKFHLV